MSKEDAVKEGTFDLRKVLNQRDMPEDDISFYTDEVLGRKIESIQNKIAESKIALENLENTDYAEKLIDKAKATVKEFEKAAADLREEISSVEYTAHITAITEGRKAEIARRSLKEIPTKRDFYGEDPEVAFKRNIWTEREVIEACVVYIKSPEGAVQYMSPSLAKTMCEELPAASKRAIQAGINRINDDSDWIRYTVEDPDFS